MDYSDFIQIFPELECDVEEGVAYNYWQECAVDLLEALGCPTDEIKSLGLATAHYVWIKSHPNGNLKEEKHVNSRVVYQSNKTTEQGELSLRDSKYGQALLDSLILTAENTVFSNSIYWYEY